MIGGALGGQQRANHLAPTARTRHGRAPHRGTHDRETINQILDSATVCHLGFTVAGQPFVVPTAYVRSGGVVYVHGSTASRALGALRSGAPVCLTVTLLDGLVLARSAFNHSMNYRSVMVLGIAEEIIERDAKLRALRLLTDGLVPGRWEEVRQPTDKELRATAVFALPLDEASAKTRSGPPEDDDSDYSLEVWAGVIPMRLACDPAVPDPALASDLPLPRSVAGYRQPGEIE